MKDKNMSKFDHLVEIISELRDRDTGCPWDLKQTAESLVPNFIEELYETVEAIHSGDDKHLVEELGDLLLHILMQARIAEENDKFSIKDVIQKINEKLIRRHPHIFCESYKKDMSSSQVKYNWEKIKFEEKKDKRKSLLDGIPKTMPALIFAQRMQEKAASAGFDWDSFKQVLPKLKEEISELESAIEDHSRSEVIEEIGDLLFSVVNLSRKLEIDSESALKKACEKFYTRFSFVEKYHEDNEESLFDSSLEKLNNVWELSKKNK